jgi:membrane protein implicated in regulation of membrane protease activity
LLAFWWTIAFLALLLAELATPGLFFFACLGLGALGAALAGFLGAGVPGTWAVFFVLSAVLVLGAAPLARRWLRRVPVRPVGFEALIGQRAQVVEALDPDSGKGMVQVGDGGRWLALPEQSLPVGAPVEVVEIVGTRLRVRPWKGERR